MERGGREGAWITTHASSIPLLPKGLRLQRALSYAKVWVLNSTEGGTSSLTAHKWSYDQVMSACLTASPKVYISGEQGTKRTSSLNRNTERDSSGRFRYISTYLFIHTCYLYFLAFLSYVAEYSVLACSGHVKACCRAAFNFLRKPLASRQVR